MRPWEEHPLVPEVEQAQRGAATCSRSPSALGPLRLDLDGVPRGKVRAYYCSESQSLVLQLSGGRGKAVWITFA